MAKVSVSAVMTVRNGAAFIGEALQSVFDQTCPPQEVIVVDDGSTDETPSEVSRFPDVRYVRQPAQGFTYAYNHGVRLSSEPYLTFLDADDLWHSTKTQMQYEVLSTDAEIDFVFGFVVQFKGAASEALSREPNLLPGRMMGSVMIKRESLLKVGPLASDWKVGSPVEWWARAMERGLRGELVPSPALLRRIHEHNMGRVTHEPLRDYLKILHATVNRRRNKQ